MITYIYRNTNSDFSVSGAIFYHSLLENTASSWTVATGNIGASAEVSGYAWTQSGEPGTNGDTGNYTVEVNVTSGNTNIQISTQVARVNSSGTVQSESSLSSEQQATAGVKTFNFTNLNLGTWSSGDRLRIRYRFRGTHTHGNQACSIEANTTDTEVVTPFVGPSGDIASVSGVNIADISSVVGIVGSNISRISGIVKSWLL